MTTILTPSPTLADLFTILRQSPEPYPSALKDARRAEFVAAIEAYNDDPDACDVGTEPVTDEQDERNSHPYPY